MLRGRGRGKRRGTVLNSEHSVTHLQSQPMKAQHRRSLLHSVGHICESWGWKFQSIFLRTDPTPSRSMGMVVCRGVSQELCLCHSMGSSHPHFPHRSKVTHSSCRRPAQAGGRHPVSICSLRFSPQLQSRRTKKETCERPACVSREQSRE